MCGIVAAFSYKSGAPAVDRARMERIRGHMASRGPDGRGEWYSEKGRIGFGHRRLAIIDTTDSGSQPMISSEGGVAITYNGEIYNYRALRKELQEKGYRFSSSSDTEVLLHLYRDKGTKMLNDLRGMYAFALWDGMNKELLLARDPFGIKPLYYSDDGGVFLAASQVKALLAGGSIDTAPSPAGHAGFFLWGHVPEPHTLYRGIRALPAGCLLKVTGEGPKPPRVFCSIREEIAKSAATEPVVEVGERKDRLRAVLTDSIRHHFEADVPVGLFLSSGIDSAAIAAFVSDMDLDLRTVTLGFEEYKGTARDETPLAEAMAGRCGARHETIWISPTDFQSEREKLFTAMDQPSIDGVNTYFVSRAASQTGLKVALSGLGGDEIFGGYPSFTQLPKMTALFAPFRRIPALGSLARAMGGPLLSWWTSPKYAGLLEYGGSMEGAYLLRRGLFMPWELPSLVGEEVARTGLEELQTMENLNQTVADIGDPRLRVSALELSWYMRNQLLRDTDWAGMAHSLEVRVPFVDLDVLRALSSWHTSSEPLSKTDLGTAPANPLFLEILARRKSGFSVPVREWLAGNGAPEDTERGLRGWARRVYTGYTAGDGVARN